MSWRRRYDAYITSDAWYTRRDQWHTDRVAATGHSPVCAVCGHRWTLTTGHLHHRSYHRLGHEHHRDLIPLCQADHTALHRLWDSAPAWRRLGRPAATAGIVAALRRQRTSPRPCPDRASRALVGMTPPTSANHRLEPAPGADRLAALTAFFGDDELPDLDELAPPVHWPSVAAADAAAAWTALRAWVTGFQHRFPTQTRLPECWWRHNELVEALAALRDHERACYAATAPPTAAVEFHRAFRDLEARWETWTRRLRCAHDPTAHDHVDVDHTEPDGWADWVAADVHRREHQAIRHALHP